MARGQVLEVLGGADGLVRQRRRWTSSPGADLGSRRRRSGSCRRPHSSPGRTSSSELLVQLVEDGREVDAPVGTASW